MATDFNAAQMTAIVAGVALTVSVINFAWTVFQKKSDAVSGKRKQLTDLMFELSNVALTFEHLNGQANANDANVISFRRTLNSRRTFIVEYATKIAFEIPSVVSSTEHRILASAWDSAGNRDRAKVHWELAVARSDAPAERIYCLRGLAAFLYWIGQPAVGRAKYEEASRIETPAIDAYLSDHIDTYMLWANTERRYGYNDEARRLLVIARAQVDRIANIGERQRLIERIDKSLAEINSQQ